MICQKCGRAKSGKVMQIPKEDIEFIKETLMPWCRIDRLYIAWSNSRAKYPDIWVTSNTIPTVTITREWLKHNTHLRRSQLVHEFLHLKGLKHGRVSQYDYNTRPELDTYSKFIYERIIGRKVFND